MNPAGHAALAEMVVLPVIRDALRQRGYTGVPLQALALGNWLTDVQQLVDPGTFTTRNVSELRQKMTETLDTLISVTLVNKGLRAQGIPTPLPAAAAEAATELRQELGAAFDWAFKSTAGEAGAPDAARHTNLFDLLRTGMRFAGYFRYVHPKPAPPPQPEPPLSWSEVLGHNGQPPDQPAEPAQEPRMSLQAYLYVFDKLFTQYYPHDHMDRPPVLPGKEPPAYGTAVSNKLSTPYRQLDRPGFAPTRVAAIADAPTYRADSGRATLKHSTNGLADIYGYLAEDIEIAAGRLAEVERKWAQPMFDGAEPPAPDDPEWHLQLAMMGRALHAVEDFFAHSNFVEHAINLLQKPLGMFDIPQRNIFSRRLLRWYPEGPRPNGAAEEENFIVTGYFDSTDSLISILHFAFELFGFRLVNPVRKLFGEEAAITEEFVGLLQMQTFTSEASAILVNPKGALADKTNSLAQELQNKLPAFLKAPIDEATVGELLKGSKFHASLPPEIQALIVQLLVKLAVVWETGKMARSGYEFLKTLASFMTNPLACLLERIASAGKDLLEDVVIYYSAQAALAAIGATRLGCHSLLAKDEDTSPCYEEARQCAAAVGWFIARVMTRQHPALRSSYRGLPGISNPTPTPGENVEPIPFQHIDWLDLLVTLLDHPAAQIAFKWEPKETVCDRIHTVDNVLRIDSLATLARLYLPTAAVPASFTWRTIADANYATERLPPAQVARFINEVLKKTGKGNLVAGGKVYAYKPGTRIIIPQQRRMLSVPVPRDQNESPWWKEVILELNLLRENNFSPPAGIKYTPLLLAITQADARIAAAANLLKTREREYY